MNFSIDNQSNHSCCGKKSIHKVYADLISQGAVQGAMSAVMPMAMPMGMPVGAFTSTLPAPTMMDAAGINMPKLGPNIFIFSSENENCAEKKDFQILLAGANIPFLRIERSDKMFFGCLGCGWSAKIVDIRGGKNEILGEIKRRCGIFKYTVELWVGQQLRYIFNTASCDMTIPCARFLNLQFEIFRTRDNTNVGYFTKVFYSIFSNNSLELVMHGKRLYWP